MQASTCLIVHSAILFVSDRLTHVNTTRSNGAARVVLAHQHPLLPIVDENNSRTSAPRYVDKSTLVAQVGRVAAPGVAAQVRCVGIDRLNTAAYLGN